MLWGQHRNAALKPLRILGCLIPRLGNILKCREMLSPTFGKSGKLTVEPETALCRVQQCLGAVNLQRYPKVLTLLLKLGPFKSPSSRTPISILSTLKPLAAFSIF